MFNTASQWSSNNNWANEPEIVPTAWREQFGRDAVTYLREIAGVSSSRQEFDDLVQRVSTIVGGGIERVTWDLDAALAVTGAPAVLRALLARRLAAAGGADAVVVGAKGAGTSLERGLAYDNPSNLVQNRVSEIQSQIPANSQGRITMGVAVVEDANGVRSVLVSTSEPRGYLRPGVSLQEGEKVVVGTGHAEADIVSYANANGLKVVDIGATRPVCASCQNVIEPTGANVSTPLKPLPKAKQ
ncbi:hypothetical protein [Pseudomonas sp. D3-10]|uniref:hypothetical protein n=1 Tax=Pseudomonas sp. D3-10 TaxID=2817392 RepID=UPI003DA90007